MFIKSLIKKMACYLKIGFVIFLLLASIPASPVEAAVGLTLNILPATITASSGSDFTVTIAVSPQAFTDLNTYRFDVSYDATVLQVVGTEGSPTGVTDGLIGTTVIPVSAATAVPPATSSWGFVPAGVQGTLRVTGNLHAPVFTGANGTGYLARINFHVIGTIYGQNANVTISNAVFTTTMGGTIPSGSDTIVYNNGTVKIPYPAITVSVSAPSQVIPGGEFVATINTSLVPDFNAFQLDLSYNQALVQVIGVQNDTTGVTSGLIGTTVIPVDSWITFPGGALGSPPTGGTIRILGHIFDNIAVTGTGYLAQVHFRVLAPSGTTSLTLTNTQLYDDWGNNYTGLPWNLPVYPVGANVSILDSLLITTNSPLPDGEVGVPYSQTLNAVGGATPFTWSIAAGSLPAGLSLNPATGVISGTPTIATGGPVTVTIRVTDVVARTITKDLSLTIIPGPGITTTSPLPGGEVGVTYSQTLTATGGTLPYTWSILSGALPAGLSLNPATGVISGTPATATGGPVVITFNVTDSRGITDSEALSITIIAPPAVTTTSPLPNGQVGVVYFQTLTATGGTFPYTWSLQSGGLPAGLTLNSMTGAITGTPVTTGGPLTITFRVTDSLGGFGTAGLAITVFAGPTITNPSPLPGGEVGIAYAQTLVAGGGTPPYTFSIQSGTLPAGLSLDPSSGLISGTPTASASSPISFMVTDNLGSAGGKVLSLTIFATPTITTVSPLAGGEVGVPYSQTLAVNGGIVPYTWAIISGTLPAGLSLNSPSGVISGTPTASGTGTINFRVTDSLGGTSTREISITIIPSPSITTTSLPNAEITVAYSQTLNATGGTPPYTWSIQSGTLPAGLGLNANTGTISGVPAVVIGPVSITFKVTDSVGGNATAGISLTVIPGPSITTTSPLPNGWAGVPYSQTLAVNGGTPPYTWSIPSGALPAGLSLNSATGVISGTPATPTSAISFTVRVIDSYGADNTKAFSITILSGPVILTASLPNGETTVPYSYTLSAAGGTLPYTWSIQSGSLPPGLSLNPTTGLISGIPVVAFSPQTITFKVVDSFGRIFTKSLSLTIIAGPSIVTTSPLANGEVSTPYNQTLSATGGIPPYIWSIPLENLPFGLSLNNATGVISGTPTTSTTIIITFRVTDSAGGQAAADLNLTIIAEPVITTQSLLPGAIINNNYSTSLAVSGGTAPFTWSLQSGALPPGLSLNTSTGVLTGIPTTTGNFSFTINVIDSFTPGVQASKAFNMRIYIRYDVNADGVINMGDVVQIERIILAKDPPNLPADANGDGTINMTDVVKIERVILLLDS